MKNPNKSSGTFAIAAALFLPLLILFVVLVRIRLLEIPLDRDEGGWAYAGQQILNGASPYTAFYHMKLPGIYYIYAFIMALFGQTIKAIHIGLLLINIASIMLVFFITKKKYGPFPALGASLFFSCASLSMKLDGFSANTEPFAVFFLLLALLVFFKALEKSNLLLFSLAGIFSGCCFIIKQPALLFTFFFILYLFIYNPGPEKPRRLLPAAIFAGGALLPFLIVLAMAASSGDMTKFTSYIFGESLRYASLVSVKQGAQAFLNTFPVSFSTTAIFLFIALAGIFPLKKSWKNEKESHIFNSLFLLFSFAVTAAGLYFRPHYYIFLLPSFSILLAVSLKELGNIKLSNKSSRLPPYTTAAALIIAALFFISAERSYLFKMTPQQVCKEVFQENPFVESIPIGEYIEKNSLPGDMIAVLGSEPQIFFYSKRRSATGHAYLITAIDSLKMQKEAISEIEAAKPAMLVFVNIRISWLLTPSSEKFIFYWYENYVKKYYEKTGVVELASTDKTNYIWGAEAKKYKPSVGYFIDIYKRKPGV